MKLKFEPVATSAALAAVIEAILGLLMSLGVMSPEVTTPLMSIVAAATVLVRRVVTPVEKVSVLLDKPVEVVNGMLGRIK